MINIILEKIINFLKLKKQNIIKILIFTIIVIIAANFTRKFDSYFISGDLQDMFIKKEYEKRYDQETLYKNLKDFSIDGNIITTTSNESWIYLDTTYIDIFKYIKIDIDLLGMKNNLAHIFYATKERRFHEVNSKYQTLKNGINYIRIPQEDYTGIRLGLTNIEGVSFSVNYVELTNKYSHRIIDIIIIFLLNIIWCAIWFIILFTNHLININECFNNIIKYFISINEYFNNIIKILNQKYQWLLEKVIQYKNIYLLFFCTILVCLIGISIYYFSAFISNANVVNIFDKKTATSLYPQTVYSVQNCEETENRFFTLHEDPQIYVSPPKFKISSTMIEFAEPVPVDSSIQIYYAKKNKNIKEINSIVKRLPKGSSEIIINLPSAVYAILRYDINIIGEWYEIKGIYVSDKETGYLSLQYFKYYIISSFFILVLLVIFLIVKRVPIEYLYLVAGMGIGLFYLLIMTPLSIPDEHHHYNSTHLLVNNLSFQEDKNISKLSNFDYSNLSIFKNVSSAYIRFAKEGIYRINNNEYRNIPKPYNINYFVLYIPQALGVLIARFLNLNFFGVFYLGRLTNLIFYVFCVFCAIKIVNEFKLPFFIIGLLPMTMHQTASFSFDAFINGISMIFIAYLISILYENNKLETKDITALSITGILLAPAKLVYFPIVSLLFFALPRHFGWKKAKGYIIAVGIFIIGLAMILLFNYNELFKTTQQPVELNWEGQHNYTFSFILEHPLQTVKIFWNTLNVYGTWYYHTMIGRYLSGLTLSLPEWYITVFLLILIGSVFYGKKDSWNPKWLHRGLFLFIIIVVVLLCLLSMFLLWTSDIRNVIRGVQGRYFIPLIPLGLLILKNKLKIENKMYSIILIGCVIWMQFLTIKHILNVTIQS